MAQSAWASRRLPGHIGGMNIANFLGSRGGPASTADLGRAGFTRYRIGLAVAEGAIVRIRRGHYALPGEASVLRAAARGWRAADLCLRCAELRLVDAGPGLDSCTSVSGTGGAARLGGTWPLPASPAPVAPCGRTGRHPDPRAALPAGTGGRWSWSSVLWAAATSAWTSSAADSRATATRRARSVLDLVIPRADSLLEVLANTVFLRAGCTCAGMSRSPGWGRWTSLLRTASSWRPTGIASGAAAGEEGPGAEQREHGRRLCGAQVRL